MIFDKKDNGYKTFEYPLNWGVDYENGTSITEFENHGIKNDYYSINPLGISRFGLFNDYLKLYYQKDGSFMLQGQLIEIEYHYNNRIIPLTLNFEHKDCITYKEASTKYKANANTPIRLENISFGYKTTVMREDIQLFFKAIVTVPLRTNDKVFMQIRITSPVNMDGKLVFKNKDKVVESFDFPLNTNKANCINWTVK